MTFDERDACNINSYPSYSKLGFCSFIVRQLSNAMPETMEHEIPAAPTKTWPPVVLDLILSEIASGRSLISVLESNVSYPSRAIWNKWVSEDRDFSARYVRAVQMGVARRHGH